MKIQTVVHEGLVTTITYEDKTTFTKKTIEALIYHAMLVSGEKHKSGFMSVVRLDSATLSRARKGRANISDVLILRIHEYTGIPVSELRWISNTKSSIDLD